MSKVNRTLNFLSRITTLQRQTVLLVYDIEVGMEKKTLSSKNLNAVCVMYNNVSFKDHAYV